MSKNGFGLDSEIVMYGLMCLVSSVSILVTGWEEHLQNDLLFIVASSEVLHPKSFGHFIPNRHVMVA